MGAPCLHQFNMEFVDAINEHNETIAQVSKEDAHAKGILHRCVIAEVKNSNGEWLLVKQSADRQDAGKLVSPVGGHVKAGESPDHALKRETMEELNIVPTAFQFIGSKIFNRKTRGKIENHLFMLYEISSEDIPVLNAESESFEYFSEKQIQKIYHENSSDFGDAFIFVLREFYPQLV